MKLFIRGSFLASLVLSLVSLAASQATTSNTFEAQAASVSELSVNGLKVIVKRRASAPTVAGGLFIRGGARNIDANDAGIENLMLASAIEAGTKMPRATIRRELASLGSGIGSAVANDYSVVSFQSTRENFDRTWEILSAVMLDPAFAREDVNINRERILAGLREAGQSPESALQNLQDKTLYSGHPYANDVTGTTENISRFSPADLRAYHKKIMQTSRLLLVIVGDVDPVQLKARVASTFGKLPQGNYKETSLPMLDFSKATLNVTQRALPTIYVQGSFRAPALRDPDYYAMRVATAILATLVYQEVRINQQLSYAPDADMNNLAANTATISVSSTDANRAVTAMLQQISLLKERTLTDEMIDDIADFFLTRHYLTLETNAAQVGELARYELIGGGWRHSFEFLNGVRSVKPEDIRDVANKYMKNIRFAVVGNEALIKKSIFVPAD